MNQATLHSRRGFTLVEIMIVILIIGLLLTIAVPNFVNARTNSRLATCLSNLREIDEAKETWAQQTGQLPSATPQQSDLVPAFMKAFPSCPGAGTYTIGSMTQNPTCTVQGHVLP